LIPNTQIRRIPEDDCGDNQVEPARLVLKILTQPISNRSPARLTSIADRARESLRFKY